MYMEQMSGKRDCQYDEDPHSHGTELCVAEGCLVCDDGTFIKAEQTPPLSGVHMDHGKRLQVFWPNC
jgi:hypothetical protein